MNRKLAITGALALAIAGCATTAAALPAGHAGPPAHCVTFDVTGRPAQGMPWDEPVTFCGRGLPSGTWECVASSAGIVPGTHITGCRRQR